MKNKGLIEITGLTRTEAHKLLHSLGFDDFGNGKPYRNRYSYTIFNKDDCEDVSRLHRFNLIKDKSYCKPYSSEMNYQFELSDYGIFVVLNAISRKKARMNCTQCNWLKQQANSVYPFHMRYYCLKNEVSIPAFGGSPLMLQRVLHPLKMFAGRKCYEGIWRVNE